MSSSRVTRQSSRLCTTSQSSSVTTPIGISKGVESILIFTDLDEERLKNTTKQFEKDQHQHRLDKIKEVLQETRKDNWRYYPVESLLGYSNLINVVLSEEFIEAIKFKKFDRLTVQCGSSNIPSFLTVCDQSDVKEQEYMGISLTMFRYKDSIRDDMETCDLIIGHCGAGTCLEALELRKPFIVVINEELADNHQLELAEKLSSEGYLMSTAPSDIVKCIQNAELFHLKHFEKGNPRLFSSFLDEFLNVV